MLTLDVTNQEFLKYLLMRNYLKMLKYPNYPQSKNEHADPVYIYNF